jgi:hypothetical protein
MWHTISKVDCLVLEAGRKWCHCHAISNAYGLCSWHNHEAHLVFSSTTLAFLTNVNEKCKSTSPSAIQVKNRQQTISTEEKLDVISRFEKGEWTVDICHNVRLICSSICTIQNNADRITERVKSGTKVFV